MRHHVVSILSFVSLAIAAACTDSSTPGTSSGASGATATTGSSGGSGGQGPATTGGQTTSGGAGQGTSGSGGAGGASGSGAGSGGGAGQTDASADTSVTLDGSSLGDATSVGDASRPAKPTAGCGKTNPPMGNRTIMTGGQMGTFNVHLPADYDATKPLPLGLGFHGFGNPACLPPQGECQGFPDLKAITVYPKSFTDGWEQSAVLQQNLQYFEDLVALMKNEYCVDESRIFVAGVSSGGQFVEHLACKYGDWLQQITPVSAAVVNAANMNCKGTPPILVIHGVTDMAGNYGQDVAAMFARRNGCSATPPAGLAKAKTDMTAAFMAKRAEHVCLDWDACAANPVRFCISSQITYDGLTHGWPRVGGTLISEFRAGLP